MEPSGNPQQVHAYCYWCLICGSGIAAATPWRRRHAVCMKVAYVALPEGTFDPNVAIDTRTGGQHGPTRGHDWPRQCRHNHALARFPGAQLATCIPACNPVASNPPQSPECSNSQQSVYNVQWSRLTNTAPGAAALSDEDEDYDGEFGSDANGKKVGPCCTTFTSVIISTHVALHLLLLLLWNVHSHSSGKVRGS